MPTMQERDRILAKQQPYGLAPEDDSRDYTESRVINITDEEVVFRIAQGPGAKPRRYRLAPYESGNAAGVNLQDGYAKPYKGAGRKLVRPIIERETMRHVYPRGPRLPMVVHEDRAEEARAAWVGALEAHAAATGKPIQAPAPRREPPRAPAREVAPQRDAPKLIGEEVGNEPIEPPHPDDVEVFADGEPAEDLIPQPVPTRKGRG